MTIAASNPGGHAFYGVGLRPFACWDCGFESRWGAWRSVSCECCVLSGRGVCVCLITRPEESCGLSECDRENLASGGPGSLEADAPWRKKSSLQVLRPKIFSRPLLIPYELYVQPQHPLSFDQRNNMW